MPDIKLEPIKPSEFSRYSDWFNEGANDLLASTPEDLETMMAGTTEPLVWRLILNNETLALVTISVNSLNIGKLNLVVDPRVRRRGVGNAAIRTTLQQPEVKQLRALESEVSASNIGGQKILIKNGFAKAGHSPDGNMLFRLD